MAFVVQDEKAQAAAFARAKRKFIIRYGVLGFGLFWGAVMGLLMGFGVPFRLHRLDLKYFVMYVVAGPFLGWMWGLAMWKRKLEQLQKRQEKGRD
jgi:hypothetical protein